MHQDVDRLIPIRRLLVAQGSAIQATIADNKEGCTAAPVSTSAGEAIPTSDFLLAALHHKDDVAIEGSPVASSFTYSDLLLASVDFASQLRASLPPSAEPGLEPQDGPRVGIFAKPGPEFVAALWGTWIAGAIAVPLCVSHPAAELQYVLENAGVAFVSGPEESRKLLVPLAGQCSVGFLCSHSATAHRFTSPSSGNGSGEDADAKGRQEQQRLQELEDTLAQLNLTNSHSGALIIYTSGTTGKPKGVVHTHAGLAAQARMLVDAWGYCSSDAFLHCLPLHHVHGVMNALLAPLAAGASIEFLPKFNPGLVWDRWAASNESSPPSEYASAASGSLAPASTTVFTGVPTHYVRLLQAYHEMPREQQDRVAAGAASLRLMMCGSAACPEPLMAEWEQVTGHRLLERYGMTEFGMALANPLQGTRKPGHVGFPLPGCKTKIRVPEPEEGEAAAPSASDSESKSESEPSGELCVWSPGLFREYWGREEATAEAFDSDGFFLTGDTVSVDAEGYFKILGRTSVDIIKSGGYKLSALEIEAKLLEHPLISEIAILGIEDSEYGEIVAAVAVLQKDAAGKEGEEQKTAEEGEGQAGHGDRLTLSDLRRWARSRMAHYKMPSKLRIIEQMPRNAMGKVNKKELRKEIFG